MNRTYQYLFDTFGLSPFDFRDKTQAVRDYIRYMLNRTQMMFTWEGLPDTIPARTLELYLQCYGYAGFVKVRDSLYVMRGSLGGEPDYNYMPTILTVANPYLRYDANLRINEDCVVMPNDAMYAGLLPMFRRYATALSENDLSMNLATINTRIISLLVADDDTTAESARKYLMDIEDGKAGVIAKKSLLDGITVQPYTNTNANGNIKTMIEYHQYIKASWFNDLGLDANYNMKRETLTDSENQMNRDHLLPLIENMLTCRQEAIAKVNEMFGTNITVRFNSAWADNEEELTLDHEMMIAEIDKAEAEADKAISEASDMPEGADSDPVEQEERGNEDTPEGAETAPIDAEESIQDETPEDAEEPQEEEKTEENDDD